MAALLPPAVSLRLIAVTQADQLLTLQVAATGRAAPCPTCGQPARSVHSRYGRRLADLPVQGLTLRFHLQMRRFYCRQPECPHRIFCERLGSFAAPHARQTERLQACWELIAQALGGNAGARLAERLSLPASASTLLRRLHQTSLPPVAVPRVVGIDDWAYTRGQRYGTIVVDLERRRVIDLLPDRTAETVAAWLGAHPGIEVVSRDRAGASAEACRLGAPQAEPVAGRWHWLHNLTEAVERVVEQHHRTWRALVREVPAEMAAPPESPVAVPPAALDNKLSVADERRQARLERRQARCAEVLPMRAAGAPSKTTATCLRLHRRDVRLIRTGESVPRAQAKRRRCALDAHAGYLEQRWAEGCRNAAQLWRELREQGFAGSARSVRHWVRWHHRPESRQVAAPSIAALPSVSPRQIAWALLGGPRVVEDQTRNLVQRFRERVPEVDRASHLAGEFARLLREKREQELDGWLEQAQSSGLVTFAAGLRRDGGTVRGVFCSPWSQGQVEGQVHRLKLLKRQMYGRAGFALLRQRTLLAQAAA